MATQYQPPLTITICYILLLQFQHPMTSPSQQQKLLQHQPPLMPTVRFILLGKYISPVSLPATYDLFITATTIAT
jgi:hypothetical protein